MAASSIGRQCLGIPVQLVLLRLLSPADFGIFALVISVCALGQVLSELGISLALVQRKNISNRTVDSAFFVTAMMALLLSSFFWCSAPWIEKFYGQPGLAGFVRIAVACIFLHQISSVYRSLLLRDLRFRAISAIDFTAVLIQSSLTVLFALLGFGAMGLVLGYTAGALVTLLTMALLSGYIPRSFGAANEIKELLSFGLWVFIGRILGRISSEFDKLTIGRIVAPWDLGLYYFCQKITSLVPQTMVGLLDQLMLPVYSRWQDNLAKIERHYWRTVRITAVFGLPFCAFLPAFSPTLIPFVFGEKWRLAIPLMLPLAIFAAMNCLGGGVIAAVVYGAGKPHLSVAMNLFRFFCLPAFIVLGSSWGTLGVAWGVAAYGLIGRLFTQFLATRFLGFRFWSLFKEVWRPVSLSVVSATCGILVSQFGSFLNPQLNSGVADGLGLFSGLAFYLLLCRRFLPQESVFILEELHNRLRKLRIRRLLPRPALAK